MQRKMKTIIGLAVGMVVALSLMACIYLVVMPAMFGGGEKNISVEIIVEGAVVFTTDIHTYYESLGDALLEEELIEGDRSQMGLYITSVNGLEADDSRQQWWCITKSGEMVMTSVDNTPIFDGDRFELTLVEGY